MKSSPTLQEFRRPDWSAPIDVDGQLAKVPQDATVKGLLLQSVCKQADRARVGAIGRSSYTTFRDYPVREYMGLLLEGAHRIYPDVALREALRRLGRPVFRNLTGSLIGKVVYGSLGRGPEAAEQALRKISKGYSIATNHSKAELEHFEYGLAIVHLRNVWSFPNAYQVGVLEGAFDHYGYDVQTSLEVRSSCEVRILLEWATQSGS